MITQPHYFGSLRNRITLGMRESVVERELDRPLSSPLYSCSGCFLTKCCFERAQPFEKKNSRLLLHLLLAALTSHFNSRWSISEVHKWSILNLIVMWYLSPLNVLLVAQVKSLIKFQQSSLRCSGEIKRNPFFSSDCAVSLFSTHRTIF